MTKMLKWTLMLVLVLALLACGADEPSESPAADRTASPPATESGTVTGEHTREREYKPWDAWTSAL